MSDQPPKPADFKAMAASIRQSIKNLESERDSIQERVDLLNNQIGQLELVLSTLAPLVEEVRLGLEEQLFVEGISDLKLTEAVRQVMKAGPSFRSARGVRDTLEWSGYDLTQHNNPLASIHGVLKRLTEAGEIEEAEVNGASRYRRKPWRGAREILISEKTD